MSHTLFIVWHNLVVAVLAYYSPVNARLTKGHFLKRVSVLPSAKF